MKTFFNGEDFDERFRYDGKDLGVCCTDEGTIFKVWSPFAKKIELRLYQNDGEEACIIKGMEPEEKGVWWWT